MADGFQWSKHEKDLDRIFFRNFPLIPRGSQDHKDFWKFFHRYQKFNNQSGRDVTAAEEFNGNVSSDVFSFPPVYDKLHRINCTLSNDDHEYQLRQIQQRREDERKRSSPLTPQRLKEFHLVIRHFVNFLQRQKFQRIQKIRKDQRNLPIFQYKDEILSAIKRHQVVLIAGDTGCGKSTQVPQYLLRANYGMIACTQPRRIACISLSKRVSYETLNEYGTEIAYQVRFERSRTPATRVLFLTEGLLLRQLGTDPQLSRYSVVIVDEVHERHINGDFLLGILRLLIDTRTDLKLILMSATINIQLFSDYFQGAPVIRVPGRLYPIELQYRPISATGPSITSGKSQKFDPQPYLRVLQSIDAKYPQTERGDVLVFLSGINEIAALLHEVKTYSEHTGRWIALPLHSALAIEEQDKVFDIAPDGVRKCVISTNIAETSITIDGIRFVIDSGKVKEMAYDSQTKMNRLQEFWISQASSEQRKGRAGRTGPGTCFRLYSQGDFESFSEYATPEIQRVPLESLVLQTIALNLGNVRKFPYIEPPATSNIETSVSFLIDQNALTSSEKLTPIGKMLAQLPVDVIIGKMLIMASLFHVIDPVLIVAAGLSVQSPFTQNALSQADASQVVRQQLESEHGDPFTLLKAFDEWINVKTEGVRVSSHWCRTRGIEQQRLYEMVKLRQQFRDVLMDHRLIEKGSNDDKSRWSMLSEDQQQELRSLRKRHRTENKQKKILKTDEGSAYGGDNIDGGSEEVTVADDLKHLEFKLLHDLSQLQDGSSERHSYTLQDINLLKIVICSGLYPQVAIPDEANTSKKGSELIFHTKSKGFLVLHPTSVFSTNPECLDEDSGSKGCYLLAYEKLLETNRPYMVNVLKVPALPTLLLFSQTIDSDKTCSRFVIDEWLEIKFAESSQGQEVMSIVQTLRSTWSRILEIKLSHHHHHHRTDDGYDYDGDDDDDDNSTAIQNLEDLLGTRLAQFLSTHYNYALSQIPSTVRPHLYKGPTIDQTHSSDTSAASLPHPVKGGLCITDYFTYDCLVDSSQAEASSSLTQHLRNVWKCPHCQQSLVVNLAEQLSHYSQCEIQQHQEKLKTAIADEGDSMSAATKDYHCTECDKTFKFTTVDILRHKLQHKKEVVN